MKSILFRSTVIYKIYTRCRLCSDIFDGNDTYIKQVATSKSYSVTKESTAIAADFSGQVSKINSKILEWCWSEVNICKIFRWIIRGIFRRMCLGIFQEEMLLPVLSRRQTRAQVFLSPLGQKHQD